MLGDPRFMKRVHETYSKLLDEGLEEKLLAIVDVLHERVNQTQKLNFEKWGITNVYGGLEKYHEWTDYDKYPEQLKTFITARLAFLKKTFQELYEKVCASKDAEYNPSKEWWDTGLTTGSYLNQTVVNRTFKANQWNTYCMPFAVTQAQLGEVLGEGVKAVEHVGMDLDAKTMLFAPVEGDLKAGICRRSGMSLLRPERYLQKQILNHTHIWLDLEKIPMRWTLIFKNGKGLLEEKVWMISCLKIKYRI